MEYKFLDCEEGLQRTSDSENSTYYFISGESSVIYNGELNIEIQQYILDLSFVVVDGLLNH